MKIYDLTTDILSAERILPKIETEGSLEKLPKLSSVYVFSPRVLRDKEMSFEECYSALMEMYNNVPVCLVTSDMAEKFVCVEFADGEEPVRIPSPKCSECSEQDEKHDENNLLTEVLFHDQFGVYVRRKSEDVCRRQVVFLWVDKIVEFAGREHFDSLFALAALHEMMHALLDVDVEEQNVLEKTKNYDIRSAGWHFFFNREEVLANALALMFLLEFCTDDEFISDFVEHQPKPYSQVLDVMPNKQLLLIFASNWLLYKQRFEGNVMTFPPKIEKTIEIPYSIRLHEFDMLTSFVFPNGTKEICDAFLENFHGLRSVTIPDSVEVISERAFANCTNLREIVLPASVRNVGLGIFSGCDMLTNVSVDELNENYYSQGECIIERGSDVVVAGCRASVIPQVCLGIGELAFGFCNGLKSITLPDPLHVIKKDAFFCCGDLEEIEIPEAVKHIGECAFYSCDNLEKVVFKGAPCLHNQCFGQCKKLRTVKGLSNNNITAEDTTFFASGDDDILFDVKGGIKFVKEI